MTLITKPIIEQVELAVTSTSEKILTELVTSPYMNVRRAIARNRNTPRSVMEILANDPVLNISYMAIKSGKAISHRDFGSELNCCVTCEIDERRLDCANCPNKNKHKF